MQNNGCCEYNRMIDCNAHTCFNCGWNPVVKAERISNWKNNMNDDFYWDLLMEQHEQM